MVDLGKDRLGARVDDFYEALMEAHRGLDVQQSEKLNARLVLILANAVGDYETLKAAIERAKQL